MLKGLKTDTIWPMLTLKMSPKSNKLWANSGKNILIFLRKQDDISFKLSALETTCIKNKKTISRSCLLKFLTCMISVLCPFQL